MYNERQGYYNEISIYQTAQYIKSDCADITFYNNGTANVNVNGIVLLPNQTLAFSANECEIDKTKYNFFFVGAGARSLTVIRKLYID
jgi:hypothetical protein